MEEQITGWRAGVPGEGAYMMRIRNCHVNVCRSGDRMEQLERIWATQQVDSLGTKLMGGLVSHGEGDSNRGVCRSISTCVRLSSRKQTEAVESSNIRNAGAGEAFGSAISLQSRPTCMV